MANSKAILSLRGAAWLAIAALSIAAALSPAQADTKLRVGKAQAETFSFVPLDVGIEAGLFKKHGIDAEGVDFAGSAKLQQGLAADSIDIGLGSGPELAFVAKGAPVLGVAVLADAPAVIHLAVLKDGPVKTIADLKGRLVSVSTKGSLTEWLTQELSRQQGWGTDGIRTVGLGSMSSQTAALKTHQIDGMTVEISTDYRLQEAGLGRTLVGFGDFVKDFHNHIIYARRDLIDKNPEAVRGFLAGWFETIDWMFANRDKTVVIATRVMGTSPAVATRIYDELMPAFSRTGHYNPKALAVLARSFVDMGMLPKEPDMQSLITEKFLPASHS